MYKSCTSYISTEIYKTCVQIAYKSYIEIYTTHVHIVYKPSLVFSTLWWRTRNSLVVAQRPCGACCQVHKEREQDAHGLRRRPALALAEIYNTCTNRMQVIYRDIQHVQFVYKLYTEIYNTCTNRIQIIYRDIQHM